MQGISLSRNDASVDADSNSLQRSIAQLAYLKAEADRTKAEYEAFQENFIKVMESSGRKTAKNAIHKVTVVKREVVKIDEKALAKALGAAMWNKITKKSLDKTKLEDKIETGEIDVNVVSQHTSVTEAKPYVRVSAVLEDDNPDE